MAYKNVIQCNSCEADFTIKHDMDKEVYVIEYCPFCGDNLSNSEQDEDEDEGY